MTFKYRHKKQIIIVIIILIITAIASSTIYYYNVKPNDKNKKDVLVINKKEKAESKKEEIKNPIKEKEEKPKEEIKKEKNITYKIDIKGEVKKPGIYELQKDSRVIDAIYASGGLTNNANTSVINLSKKIYDEMVIIVYSNLQVKEFKKTKEEEKLEENKCKNPDNNEIKNDACVEHNSQNNSDGNTNDKINFPISLNHATAKELENLPGIGTAKAIEIIKYRDEHKGFKTLEELKSIPGIGEQIFAKIKENITL